MIEVSNPKSFFVDQYSNRVEYAKACIALLPTSTYRLLTIESRDANFNWQWATFAPRVVTFFAERQARYGAIDLDTYNGVTGLVRAVATGRLNSAASIAVKKMSFTMFLRTVYDLIKNCDNIEEYAPYLNKKYQA
jgi:hypothetical protein